jgi:hypothetical protein
MSCDKCAGEGAYVVKEPAETFVLPDGGQLVSGPAYLTRPCECRKGLEPRNGVAAWWSLEQVYAVDVTVPVFNELVEIRVSAEVPMSADNYRVHRRGNRYYPTLVEVECPDKMTLHACTARTLAKALLDAAEAAERVDDADTDPRCGHWAPCDCAESATADAAVARTAGDSDARPRA